MQSTITFDISTTNANSALGVEVWLNHQLIMAVDHVIASIPVEIPISEDDAAHELKITLKNKTANHTTVDSVGNIVQDSCLVVNNFKFDDIEIDQLVSEQAVYRHDFNGCQPPLDDQFYWCMGCNGTVLLKFNTPVYIWLLENM